jgi:VanZ family protein
MVDVPISLMAIRRSVIAANLIYAVVLLVLGLVPNIPKPVAGISDHVAHAAAYAIQTIFLFFLLVPHGGRGRAAILAVAGAVLYGGCVEMLQSFQPARTVEVADLVANAVGAGAAASLVYLVTSSRSIGVRR